MRPLVVVAALLLPACASEPTVRWGEETPVEKAQIQKLEAPKPKTATEYAAGFPTDGACEAEARRINAQNRERALKLLGACIARGDFKKISALVDAPWTPDLHNLPEALTWCARIVAARAGDVEGDVKSCAKIGIDVHTLEQISAEPDKVAGRLVIFRGRLDPEHKGRDIRLIETTVEGADVDAATTGRRVSAAFASIPIPSGDAVILGRASKMAEDVASEDGDPMAVVDVLGSFVTAERPTFN